MLYVDIIILILFLILFIKAMRYSKDDLEDTAKKKDSLYVLYPLARFILIKSGVEKKLLNKTDLSEKVRAISFSDNQEIQVKLYWYQKTSIIILCILVFSSLSLITQIKDKTTNLGTFETQLTRPEDGQGDELIELRFRMEKDSNKDDYYEDEIVIQNSERIYTDGQWDQILDKAIPYLEQEMLGVNKDAKHVSSNLNFISQIPETSIIVEWIPKDYLLIANDGKINNTDMDKEKEDTLVTAVLKYKDKKVEHTIPITILPVELEEDEMLYEDLKDTLEETARNSAVAEKWNLPKQIGEYSILWERPASNSSISIFLLGLLASVLLWFYKDKELDDRMKLRNNQMLLDYPEIINKFNLLVNAGMTIKQAWIKISEDYKELVDSRGGEIRYAYEEMLLTVHELKLGIAETNAYEQFGKRVGLLPFMKFSSMLVQNLRKGNKGMIDLLKRESIEAFQERKDTAKRLGEEASTKLLGPMIVMLIIVLVIIMIPAFTSFGI